jgi:hypothetical protein
VVVNHDDKPASRHLMDPDPRHLLQGEILSQRNLFKFAVRAIYVSGVTVIRELWLEALP